MIRTIEEWRAWLQDNWEKIVQAKWAICTATIAAGALAITATHLYDKSIINARDGTISAQNEHIQGLKDQIAALGKALKENVPPATGNVKLDGPILGPDDIVQNGSVVAAAFAVSIDKTRSSVNIQKINAHGDLDINREIQWRNYTFYGCQASRTTTASTGGMISSEIFYGVNCSLK